MTDFLNSESSDDSKLEFHIIFKADETFDFEEELKIDFYKAVSSYSGSKNFDENSFNPFIILNHNLSLVKDPRKEFIAG